MYSLLSAISFFINILSVPIIEELYSTRSLGGNMILEFCPQVHDYAVAIVKALVTGLQPEVVA